MNTPEQITKLELRHEQLEELRYCRELVQRGFDFWHRVTRDQVPSYLRQQALFAAARGYVDLAKSMHRAAELFTRQRDRAIHEMHLAEILFTAVFVPDAGRTA